MVNIYNDVLKISALRLLGFTVEFYIIADSYKIIANNKRFNAKINSKILLKLHL
jgi:hypothetical protein